MRFRQFIIEAAQAAKKATVKPKKNEVIDKHVAITFVGSTSTHGARQVDGCCEVARW